MWVVKPALSPFAKEFSANIKCISLPEATGYSGNLPALVNEATSMMSNLQGNNSLFDNLMKQAGNLSGMGNPAAAAAAANKASQASSGNATRDRLRRKLDAKKNASK